MADPIRHHFLPVFYLKNWRGDDGRLVEFSTPFRDVVKPKRVHPKGTGYIDKLYAMDGFPGKISYEIEQNFLSPVDSRASVAMKALLSATDVRLQDRDAWSHFAMTLLMRMPTEILLLKEIAKKIETHLADSLFSMFLRHCPPDFHDEMHKAIEEIKSSSMERAVRHVMRHMSSEELIAKISEMEWRVLDVSSAPYELLSSDRPIAVVRNGNSAESTVIALPISPKKLFVAATHRDLIKEFQAASPKKVVQAMNTEVVTGAHRFVYGSSDRQLAFVRNHFGRSNSPSFVEGILRTAGLNVDEYANAMMSFNDNNFRAQIDNALETRRELPTAG